MKKITIKNKKMKKIYLLIIAFFLLIGTTYAQNVQKYVTYTKAGFRSPSTNWDWQPVNLTEGVTLSFYCNSNTDITTYIDYIKISNGYNDFFKLPYIGILNSRGGIEYSALDKDNRVVMLELINRGSEGQNNYLELYIRYNNIEYNYKFKRKIENY
jgi:hypothetical protein